MVLVLDAFISRYSEKMAKFLEDEAAMIRGVGDELTKLSSTLETMMDVLRDAENERIKDTAINKWRVKLQDIMYDADDILDRWRIESKKLSTTPQCFCFSTLAFRRNIAHESEDLRKRLDDILKEKSILDAATRDLQTKGGDLPESDQLPDPDVVGVAEGTRILVDEMYEEEWDRQHLPVFAILGMGGVGKTTLARQVYNDQRIKDGFRLRIWLCVSRTYSETGLLKQMIRMLGGNHGQAEKKAELVEILTPLLWRIKLFLVLDDVWEDSVWVDLLRRILVNSEARGRILVTSRLRDVAAGIGAVRSHGVKKLSAGEGWELLCKKVFQSGDEEEARESLRDIGMELVERCDGLPLAICALAGVLVTKRKLREDWEKVSQTKVWSLGDKLNWALYLSYEDLPSHLKQCFLYFSLFPEDFLFHDKELARLWVAEDFVQVEENQRRSLEVIAEDYYEELVNRHILQPDPRYLDERHCTMHDLLRSLSVDLAGKECHFGELGETGGSNYPGSSIRLRRLSLVGSNEAQDAVRRHECLRTFMLYSSPPLETVGKDIFKRLRRLRVLDLSWTGIKALPDSIGDLVQLRFLDLDGSGITGLPESIGCLGNLQTLSLSDCESLQALPESISMLRSLRCLRILRTPLSRVPPGVAQLKQLNHLEGFVLGESPGQGLRRGCRLEDLQPLSELRFLLIDKLETVPAGDPPLASKSYLRNLSLHCTAASTSRTETEMGRMESIFESLSPPQCLKELTIKGFFGREFPGWIQSWSSAPPPDLTAIFLQDCASCRRLPPLGQLPELRFLTVVGAASITSVGPEFLGSGTRRGPRASPAPAFPSLEVLKMYEMPNWEDWSLPEQDGVDKWLPRLKQLGLKDCPKLRGLPGGLRHATALEILHIEGAHGLTHIQDLPSSPQSLQLVNNRSLEVISNLPALRNLMVQDCASLTEVSGLRSLRFLHLIDAFMDELPAWLPNLLQQHQEPGGLQELRLECNDHLFLRCIEGAAYWEIISQASRVTILTNYGCSAYLYFTKTPYSYKCNVHPS